MLDRARCAHGKKPQWGTHMTLKIRLIIALGMLTTIIVSLMGASYLMLSTSRGYTDMLVSDHLRPVTNLKSVADAYAVAIVDNVHKARAGTVTWDEAVKVLADAEQLIEQSWSQSPTQNSMSHCNALRCVW